MKELEEIKNECQKIAKFLEENYSPHTVVKIDINGVEIVESLARIPIEEWEE